MRIYLFTGEKIFTYNLPKDVFGSFSFDPNPEEEYKLLNIEARDGKWFIRSVNGVLINNSFIEELELNPGNFYFLKRGDESYTIYLEEFNGIMVSSYIFKNNLDLLIGNTKDCNIYYDFGVSLIVEIKVYYEGGLVFLESINGDVYLNDMIVKDQAVIKVGDRINIYGFRILFLSHSFVISCLKDKINISPDNNCLLSCQYPNQDADYSKEIKDEDLYNPDDYFSKAPRIKRSIEEKEFKLDNSPSESPNKDLPIALVVGPMFFMGIFSVYTLVSTFIGISSGTTYFEEQIGTILMSLAMIMSMILWPILMQIYNKHLNNKKKKNLVEKYNLYLNDLREELSKERDLQREILFENLLPISDCVDIIEKGSIAFWSKRVDQDDFLVVRVGMGNKKLAVDIKYPEKGFSVEESDLEKEAEKLKEDFEYIENVPIDYSFNDHKITAIMGEHGKCVSFINSILLQLLAYYTYEDIKIVVITNDRNKDNWEYIKFLNHNFDNMKSFRFFASNQESVKNVLDYLTMEVKNRKNSSQDETPKPYYFVLIDDYYYVKRHSFIKELTEFDEADDEEKDLGFRIIIKENTIKKAPSKCNNFIFLNDNNSNYIVDSFGGSDKVDFVPEYLPKDTNLMELTKKLANVAILFEEGSASLPDSISFLEMENVGKVEQLNIQNRWNINDSTTSLKTEVGIDNQNNIVYLDLHEKFHGPHGLIAGTTGSGKSEFIISYVLSMCINYSPLDVSFILIDYKGGGLTLAFENKTSNIILPHLAGTITNLDKAEIDRTLVSIKSEARRRQELFNKAKDKLGESTMDIYKYQAFYHEGKLDEAISHLIIICDEFAELKAQQPEFMDDLISIARIGRSLGVHLILATQKPSGVVNDQIWSNSRFRVCLKVQDEADSKEMLKKPDAAHLYNAGRFYLQVGYDELYTLGQSGYSGATYYPSDKVVKQVDKSINFINEYGVPIKSIQASSPIRLNAQGEQLINILKSIISTSERLNIKASRLWLDNIPDVIVGDELVDKYQFDSIISDVEAYLGEYDAPEIQEQGLVKYNLYQDGNTIIYGNDGSEREMLLDALIYSVSKFHSAEDVNFYIVDYGSESFMKFAGLPQVGSVIFQDDEEKYNNLLKMLKKTIKERKRKFAEYNGNYKTYVNNSEEKVPLLVIILNNFDSIIDINPDLYDILRELTRDSDKYGIIFILTGNTINSISSRILSSFRNFYSFKLKEDFDYKNIFNTKKSIVPREITGRGLFKNETGVHEFQTLSLTRDEDESKYIKKFINEITSKNKIRADEVPVLPLVVDYDQVKDTELSFDNIPVGISKSNLELKSINLSNDNGYIITGNKRTVTNNFVKSLIVLSHRIPNTINIVIDTFNDLNLSKDECPNYYTDNFDGVLDGIIKKIDTLINENSQKNCIIYINGIRKLIDKLSNPDIFNDLVSKVKHYGNISIIIVDDEVKIKSFAFEEWYKKLFNANEGIWVGNGIIEQSLLRVAFIDKSLNVDVKSNYGYLIEEGKPTFIKMLNFFSKGDEEDD